MDAQQKIDLNHASREELAQLPYVGERLADAIILYRQTHGGFRSLDDLDNVGGIDRQVKTAIQDRIRV